MKKFILMVLTTTVLSLFVFEPFLEYITGVEEKTFNLIWWIDVCMILEANIIFQFLYEKYFRK